MAVEKIERWWPTAKRGRAWRGFLKGDPIIIYNIK
jgi:hypothetical protein